MKTIKFTALLLAITAIVSCQKENIDPAYHSDPSAVKLTASVGSPFTRSNPLADGPESAAFKSGDMVAVAAGTQTAVQYTFNGTTWTPEPNKYLKWESDPMNFTAYYPVGVNGASATAFNMPDDQSTLTKLEQADYMTYTALTHKVANISLALTRKMARVIVNTSFNDQYATGYEVDLISVSGNSDGYSGGTVHSGNVSVLSYKHTDGKFYVLMSPTTVNSTGNFLQIAVKKIADGSTETLTVKGIPAMVGGLSYTYNVKVGKVELEITNVTVTDWGTGGVIPGGEAELMATIGETGVAAPRIYVVGTGDDARLMLTKAPTNLGAFFKFGSLVATDATTTGQYKTAMVIFNPTNTTLFNAWSDIPYATEDVDINTAYHTVANVAAGKGDPCRLAGYTLREIKAMLAEDKIPDNHQWRLPTKAENETFTGGEGSYDTGGLVYENGVSGVWFPRNGSKINGFLPAAGWRTNSSSGKLSDAGYYGSYWSSTPIGGNGYILYFGSALVSQIGGARYDGYSVRCVLQ